MAMTFPGDCTFDGHDLSLSVVRFGWGLSKLLLPCSSLKSLHDGTDESSLVKVKVQC